LSCRQLSGAATSRLRCGALDQLIHLALESLEEGRLRCLHIVLLQLLQPLQRVAALEDVHVATRGAQRRQLEASARVAHANDETREIARVDACQLVLHNAQQQVLFQPATVFFAALNVVRGIGLNGLDRLKRKSRETNRAAAGTGTGTETGG